MSFAVDGTDMLRVSPQALTASLHQCENGFTTMKMSTGSGTGREQSAGDQEEMEAHLRFLNMDLEMEVLDLESCLTFGEDVHAQGGEKASEADTPRLSLRAELAKARRGKLTENSRSSNESPFQATPLKLKDVTTFSHPSKEVVAEPSPGETASEPMEYVLSSADRMQVDSLLLPEPFEPGEEEMLIRDRDMSSFQSAPEAKEEKEKCSPEHVSRQKRKLSPADADQISRKRIKCEAEPRRRDEFLQWSNAETPHQSPGSGTGKDTDSQSDQPETSERRDEKPETTPKDDEKLPGRRFYKGESSSATNTVRKQPRKSTTASRWKTGGSENIKERQGDTETNGVKNAPGTDDDTGLPLKALKMKQVGMVRVKRKPAAGTNRSDRKRKRASVVKDKKGTCSKLETTRKLKERKAAASQTLDVIEIDDSPASEKEQRGGRVTRKPETRSDRKKRCEGVEMVALKVSPDKLDGCNGATKSQTFTRKERKGRMTRTQLKLEVKTIESSGRVEKASRPVRTKVHVQRSEAEKALKDESRSKPSPVIRGSKIQRKRGVYVGP